MLFNKNKWDGYEFKNQPLSHKIETIFFIILIVLSTALLALLLICLIYCCINDGGNVNYNYQPTLHLFPHTNGINIMYY